MRVEINNEISIKQIADSGQCFRMEHIGHGVYSCIHKGKYVEIIQDGKNSIRLSCSEFDLSTCWSDYFDLRANYEEYKERIKGLSDEYLKRAVAYGSGIRILRQEPFETLISFIISQRNSIPRIIKTVDRISTAFGEKLTDKATGKTYYAFPTLEELRIADENGDLWEVSLGYRADFIAKTCRTLETLPRSWWTGANAYENVLKLSGVGEKVANCYTLFGLHDMSRFPIDVWIQKILDKYYKGGEEFSLGSCRDIAGLIQQYMFYYERSL